MTTGIPREAPAHGRRPMVFFDGGCGLCGREIAHYRRLDAARRIHWVDISRHPEVPERLGIPRDAAMAEFHVRDAAGGLHRGVSGFVEMWRHLPYYRALGWLVARLGLVRPLEWGYRRFARWRLGRRQGACTAAPHTKR